MVDTRNTLLGGDSNQIGLIDLGALVPALPLLASFYVCDESKNFGSGYGKKITYSRSL